jgi:hypothetical protein
MSSSLIILNVGAHLNFNGLDRCVAVEGGYYLVNLVFAKVGSSRSCLQDRNRNDENKVADCPNFWRCAALSD